MAILLQGVRKMDGRPEPVSLGEVSRRQERHDAVVGSAAGDWRSIRERHLSY